VQKRHGGDGISIATGGEAGTAEPDFNSCLIWSTRPGQEVPVLMVVANNGWGISTPAGTQHSERHVIDRGQPFGIPGEVVDGNDPVASWHAIERAMAFCRRERKPFILEALVSRLHGHSSSSGAARVANEPDCIQLFEARLLASGVIQAEAIEQIHAEAHAEAERALDQARSEPDPTEEDVARYTYAPSKVDAVYPEDYRGLPE
jgi:2-oxoisovalerate dehydrogenase E1 component alpha subunit